MFFDGSEVSNRAKVNLRKTATTDKNDFLKKTQQEREERLQQKLRLKSALKIQSVWRSHRILQSVRDQRRQLWDQEIQIARQQPKLQDAIHIQELTRGLLFFYSPKRPQDKERLHALAELWVQNILSNAKKQDPNNILFIPNEEKMQLYIQQVKCLLQCSQQVMSEKPEPHVRLLQFLLTPDLVIFGNNLPENEARKKVSVKITSYLVSKGLYKCLREFILKLAPLSSPSTDNTLLLQFVMTIAFRPLQYHAPQTTLTPIEQPSNSQSAFLFPTQQSTKKSIEDPTLIHQRFVADLLSIPLFTYRVANPTLIAILIQLLPIAISFEPDKKLVPKSDYVYLLGNLCVILKMLLQYYNSQIQNKDQKALSTVINFLQFTNMILRHTSKKNFYDKNQSSMDPQLLDQLRALLDAEVIRKLFSTFLPDNIYTAIASTTTQTVNSNNNFGSFSSFGSPSFGSFGSNSNSNTTVNNNNNLVPLRTLSPGIIHVCGLYSAFSSKWKTIQSSLLNNLTFSTSVVSNIWRIILNTNELAELAATGVGDIDLCNLLFLFCKSYGLLLFTASDDEFFAQTTFRLEELTTMISILKRAAFKMYATVKDTDLREAITSLLQQLYDRNARHTFSDESVWTVDDPLIETITNTNGYITDDKTRQILNNIPFVFPFDKRLKLFYDIVAEDKERSQANVFDAVRVRIRRNYVFEDGFDSLNHLNSALKKTIRVELINSDGTPEIGIDGGGIFKEFLIELIKTAYNTDYGLFKETSDRFLYPSTASGLIFPDDTKQFEFLGKILAKAIFENIMVELPLSTFFLNKLLGKFNYVNDLVFLDPLLYKNLMYLKTYDNVEDLMLTFSVVENDFGKNEVVELMPGGKDIPVTNDNKFKYIALVANYKLNLQIKRQSQAFLFGFSQIIHPDLLRMFNQHELQTLISGRPGGIDIEDMKKYAHYSGGYWEEHPVVKRFWNVLKSFTVDQQRKFLMFVTSCSRPPLLGFRSMYPAFCIHKASHSDSDTASDEFLPTASTCMNFLKLPPYSSESIMRAKILYAIEDKSGFQLS